MKEILFIINTLKCGGAEHALVSLLNVMNYEKYAVDLLVLNKGGMFYTSKDIPSEVNWIEPDPTVRVMLEPSAENLMNGLKAGKYKEIFIRLVEVVRWRIVGKKQMAKWKGKHYWSVHWSKSKRYMKPLEKHYDAAVGYLEGLSNYFCIDKVNADRKIGWVHTNYSDSNQDKKMDKYYFERFDYLVTMSEPASEVLGNVFPEYQYKIHTIHNVLDEKQVREKADERVTDVQKEFDGVTIVSVGNILPVKGYDIAAEVCARLIRSGRNVRWLVVGRKDQSEEIESIIEKNGIKDRFILLGMRSNPYQYMKMADIFVQCSRYEGFSTTIREAKVLCKPIVATNCQGINDQIQDGVNGMLVGISQEEVYQGVCNLIDNPEKRAAYEQELKRALLCADETKNELAKLEELLD